jgi:isovaleryl-CoA dehydrogenase
VSHKIADMHIHQRAATSLVYEAAQAVDAGGRARKAAAAAKIFASETATRTALDAVQILGGYGYIREFPVERLARDAKLLEIGGGTSEILRNLIVSELEGGP